MRVTVSSGSGPIVGFVSCSPSTRVGVEDRMNNDATRHSSCIEQNNTELGTGCLVDRTIPIHARTLGLGVAAHVMGHVLISGGEALQYEPICMLLVQTSPRGETAHL